MLFRSPEDGCECRKPAPGLILRAASAMDVDLASSYMIGDKESDVEAGRRAGCRVIRIGVRDGGGEIPTVSDLSEAADVILGREPGRNGT